MSEQFLVSHCSPTLAGLKTASMFNYSCKSKDNLVYWITKWNRELNGKGVHIELLKITDRWALVYVYRRNRLKEDLEKLGVDSFLMPFGYKNCSVDYCIDRLKERVNKNEEFPHEIGVFLGYPLKDVTGFIENEGQNSKCTGCWKVYCNEYEALRLFEKYKKCKDVYMRLHDGGRSILQLTISA